MASKGEGEGAETAADEPPAPVDPAARVLLLVREYKLEEALEVLRSDPQLWRAADDEGHTLMHWAALSGGFAGVEFLSKGLAAGCAVDAAAQNGQTPLMWAVIRGHVKAAKVLLDARADPLARDSLGASPLVLCIQHQKPASFLLLVSAEGTRDKLLRSADKNGCGPVHWAAYKNDLTSLKLLEYFDADFCTVDELRMTPLHRAVTAGASRVFEFLLDQKVDPSAREAQGRNVLDLAKDQSDASARRALLQLLEHPGQADGRGDAEQAMGSELRRRPKKDPAADLKVKFAHNAAATFWFVSVSLASFQYLTDIRDASWSAAPYVALAFELGVPATLALFLVTVQLDPGTVPPRPKRASGVEEIMRSLEASGEADIDRLCTTTWVLKGPRTKFCVRTNACVREFDHFCGWLNVAIGRGNHRPFIFLSCLEPAVQFCHLYLCWIAAGVLVEASTDGSSTWALSVATGYPLLVLISCLHVMTAPMVTMLALNQLKLIWVNLTTNEMLNSYRYGHFWEEVERDGAKKKVFKNPFHKGNAVRNCLDFWWTRRREDRGPTPVSLAELSVRDKLRSSRSSKANSELAA